MTLDLTQFHDAFFEESFEALDSMEAALLELKVGVPNAELINTIFRVAHSIKGGSATFAFTEIASFTHSVETLLDELRGNRLTVSQSMLDVLLKSVDATREMLRAVQAKRPIEAQRVADVQFDLEMILAQRSSAPAPAAVSFAPAAAPAPVPTRRWQIAFRPYPHLFERGNDPLRILRELAALGELEVIADLASLPDFAALAPSSCYLAWQLQLATTATEAAIREIFDWTEGDCDLLIESADAPAPAPVAQVAAVDAPPPVEAPAPAAAAVTAAPASLEAAAGALGGETGSIRVSVEKIDELMNTVGELVITQSMLSQMGRTIEGPAAESLRTGLAQLERNMRELQESVMRVRMLPISFVFSRFPRMVRDLAQRLGKQIELTLTGEGTELDKTVLEKIGDPLVHLVRNSIDHGIEKPDVRIAAGKSAAGSLRLNAYHRGGNIAVEVSDDGGGLDADRILAKARSRGLVGPDETIAEAQIYELIFLPGFSTAEKTTETSGRGVGLDVVLRNVKELGGKIDVSSERGHGARFVITLPLTLAIVDGQSIAVGRENYIVPLVSIIESLQIRQGSLNRIAGRGEVFAFRGEYVPVIRLHELFGVESRAQDVEEGLIVIVEGDGRRVGLFVDDLLGQQQVVIKSLETNYGQVDGVSGATILGDGSVALILDLPGIIRRAGVRAHV
jgi:two-component system, chemotaxis family, sensor kinase CheA